jgi:hypothetical protein
LSKLKFGDYVIINQKRYGVPDEQYLHKVIGVLKSNSYVEVPVQTPATETLHLATTEVVACICCGVQEREVRNYKVSDVSKVIIPVRD